MLHRDKRIGKSIYRITKELTGYKILEIYKGTQVAKSKYTHGTIDDAIQELHSINRERYYTDTLQLTI